MANKHLLPKLSWFLPFLLILLFCCFHAHALRILFSGAVDSGTHIGSMVPLIKRLASRGHQVTVLELATLDKPRQLGPNVSVLFLPVPVDQSIATAQAAAMFRQALNGRTMHLPYQFGNQRFKEFMEREAQLFVRLLNGLPRFDLVIVDELFGVHSFALALHLHHFQQAVPYVIYSTTMMIQSSAFALALGRNFVAEPNLLTSPPVDSQDKYRAASWANRLDNLWTVGWDILRVQYQTQNFLNGPESALRMLGIDRFSFQQFFSDASFLFVDYLDRVPAPLAEGPDLVSISAHCAPTAHSLPPDLALFVDDPNSAGTIFVAFGTNVQWRFAPASTVWALFLALNRLAQHRVLVSFNAPVPANLSLGAHVRVLAWAPQADILAHPRTRLFISHAGLKSFKETLCAKMPAVLMVAVPEPSFVQYSNFH